jgi:hypothetical protein
MSLPPTGRAAAEVLAELEKLRADDVDWRRGRAFSLAYFAGDEVLELAQRAYTRFSSENALNTDAFPSLRRIQADVVGMVSGLVHGGDAAAGFMTSGGTESLLLAVLSRRASAAQGARIERPDGPAGERARGVQKAAHYFGCAVPCVRRLRADACLNREGDQGHRARGRLRPRPAGRGRPDRGAGRARRGCGAPCHVDVQGGMVLRSRAPGRAGPALGLPCPA